MSAAYVSVIAITIVMNGAAVFADLTGAKWMLAGFTQIGVPQSLLPLRARAIGTLAPTLGYLAFAVASLTLTVISARG
jgi:hypothetical protein